MPSCQTSALCIAILTLLACGSIAAGQEDKSVPLYDVPRVEKITIDGDASDWGDSGFRIDAMADESRRLRAPENSDAMCRLAWDDRGLLVLVSVSDDVHVENASMDGLWRNDSIEFFFKAKRSDKGAWQLVVAPGLAPDHPELRQKVYGTYRSEELRKINVPPLTARKIVPGGYVMEALLPWGDIGIKPSTGVELAFQIYVNDSDDEYSQIHTTWYPTTGAPFKTLAFQRIRLSDRPSEPVTAAACGFYDNLHRTRVNVTAVGSLADKPVEVRDGDKVLAAGKLKAQATHPDSIRGSAGRAAALLSFPLPLIGSEYGPLTVLVDGKPIETLELPKVDADREAAMDESEYVFNPSVFSGTHFPPGEFEDALRVEDLIGAYDVKTTYYNAAMEIVKTADQPGRYGVVVEVTGENGKVYKRYGTLFRQPAKLDWQAVDIRASFDFPREMGIDPAVGQEQQKLIADSLKWIVRNSTRRDSDVAVLLGGLYETKPGSPAATERTGPWGMNDLWWHTLRKKLGEPLTYQYLDHLPADYEKDSSKRWPLLLFLHGSGERGNDVQAMHGSLDMMVKGTGDRPFIIIVPQCPPREWWNALSVNDLLDEVCAKYSVDPDRIYLTGLSMGGYGTWSAAINTPQRFAAVAPVCGNGDRAEAARLVNLPIWMFHGTADPNVPFGPDQKMYDALRQLGARARFTVYPDAGHGIWSTTYANSELFDWFLQQKRGDPKQPAATEPTTMPLDAAN